MPAGQILLNKVNLPILSLLCCSSLGPYVGCVCEHKSLTWMARPSEIGNLEGRADEGTEVVGTQWIGDL